MNVHFYCYEPDLAPGSPALPSNLQIHCWQPEVDGFPAPSRRLSNVFWWALAMAGGFERPDFAEICIKQGSRVLQRLIVTPAWYRFPFMSARDLQIGAVWTAPSARRRNLARIAIAEASRFADGTGRLWYVTDEENYASAALARSCGFRLAAVGERTRRFGLAFLGQYVIRSFV